jgi:regulator of sigma E protease
MNTAESKFFEKKDVLESLGIEIYKPQFKAIIGEVVKHSPAKKAGLQSGDIIISFNGEPINYWHEMLNKMQQNGIKPIQLFIQREHKDRLLIINPELKRIDGKPMGVIGIIVQPQSSIEDWIRIKKYGFSHAVTMAYQQTQQLISMSIQMIWKMISGQVSTKHIGGPIGIAEGAGQTASAGMSSYLFFLALISVSLGVINLMPLPVLDGGHLLFLAIELIIGRSLSRSIREKANAVGIMLILALTSLAMFNDIIRILY